MPLVARKKTKLLGRDVATKSDVVWQDTQRPATGTEASEDQKTTKTTQLVFQREVMPLGIGMMVVVLASDRSVFETRSMSLGVVVYVILPRSKVCFSSLRFSLGTTATFGRYSAKTQVLIPQNLMSTCPAAWPLDPLSLPWLSRLSVAFTTNQIHEDRWVILSRVSRWDEEK